jgi:superfamily II DNA or RNA helicase
MSLKDLCLKNSYDSESDDILEDFYIPALTNVTNYKRLAGYFSSTTLAVSAMGMSEFIINGGHMSLICCARLNKDDVDAIKEGYNSPEDILEKAFINDIKDLDDEFFKDHTLALAWMVANDMIDIKIAIVCDHNGDPVEEEIVEESGIFHLKVGIMEDCEGNKISFSGSTNETAGGWVENIEEFKVFRSWITSENEYLISDEKKFEKFTSGNSKRVVVIDIPLAIKEELVRIAPRDIEEINLKKWQNKRSSVSGTTIKLYDYQEDAVTNWINNEYKGIFEMATATGKTFPSLEIVKRVSEIEKRFVTVVVCPSDHLVKQWQENTIIYGLSVDIIVADGSNIGWKDKLTDCLYDIKNGVKEKVMVLTTYATFQKEDFVNIIKIPNVRMLLIADEVHWTGAPKTRNGLIEEYSFRLGLSATPKRYFDEEGTEKIFEYFGGVVYKFSFEDAIHKINPATGLTFLAQYEYRPLFIDLTEEEHSKYEKETKKIAKLYYKVKDNEEKAQSLLLLNNNRANIIKNAHNKYNALSKILDEIGQEIKHCLVYVLSEQMDNVQDVFLERNIIEHKFTMKEDTKPEEKYGGLSERQFLLKQFTDTIYQVLIAMRCLDEGVDIPSARMAILMASSGNPREHIQRIGRVLRNYPGKDNAIIYDIIVVPPISMICEVSELEKKILIKEMMRYKEFAYNATNRHQCLEAIGKIEDRYKVFVPIGDKYE